MAVETAPLDASRYTWVVEKISSIVLRKRSPKWWYTTVMISGAFVCLLVVAIAYLFGKGIGIWGVNNPVFWGFAIINFVWWVGIGHAGTLISAILFLFKQEWRTAINRSAEAMTLFAIACAGLFPLIHLGRPWFAYWFLPYPSSTLLWPQFRSPLMWDVFAIGTYLTVSAIFWYIGLVPDLATMRDRAQNRLVKILYGIFSLGWRGSAMHWNRYEMAYLLLAGLATPLVVSVHSVVSLDFAVGIIPGWHVTMFPPYFVAGAVFSGFAMVLTILLPLRSALDLKSIITDDHVDKMAKVMLTTGLIVGYGYIMEAFFGWYSQNTYELSMIKNRMFGPYAWAYWMLIFCNILVPQLLWIPKVRRNALILFPISIIINVGMWLERFVIVVTSLHRDFLPSAWDLYIPTFWDYATYAGTLGFFFFCFMLFIRFLPMVSIFEVSELRYRHRHAEAEGAH
ncbi:MAG: polysulfide reductase NrfD [Candidatus Poribacteria bacterium]|nr:MAG: polysulfide reductase NrfD [Candidatus Poribacteria bacterium]